MVKKQITVKQPAHKKMYEKQFMQFMHDMIDMSGQQYRNNTILSLNKGTVAKFEDAQVGNYATVLTTLANRVQRKILARFTDDRIYKAVESIFNKIDKDNKKTLYSTMAKALGVDVNYILNRENKKANTRPLIQETAARASKQLKGSLQQYTANTLRAMNLGQGLDSLNSQLTDMIDTNKRHAATIARTQVATFNSTVTKIRAQNLGLTSARWETTLDGRERKSHEERNGKEYELSKGLYSSMDGKTLYPGVEYNCRCTQRIIIPNDF